MSDTIDSRTSAAAQQAAAQQQQAADDAAIAAFAADGEGGIPDTPLTSNVGQPATPPENPVVRHVDEPGGIRDDDFGLDGDMATTLASALEARFNPDLADTDPPDPALASPDGDGAGGGGGAAQDAAPGVAPPAAATPADQFDLNTYARDYFGTDLSHEQAQQLFGVLGRLQTATPEERRYIDQVLSGQVQQGQPPAQQQQPAPVPAAAPGSPTLIRPDDEYLGPIYDQLVAPLAASQAELAAQQQAIADQIAWNTAQQQQQQLDQMSQRVDAAEATWRESASVLTDGEFDALRARTVQSGIFPGLVAMHHGNVEAATAAALDATFWSDPQLRAKALANTASGRDPLGGGVDPANPTAQRQQQLDAGRRQLAASVAGGGGAGVTRDPTPPTTAAGRRGAMVNEIAAAMAAQGSAT